VYNFDIEIAIFAAVINNPKHIGTLRDILQPEYFRWELFQDAWREVVNIHEAGLSLDGIILGDALDKIGKLKDFCIPGHSHIYGRSAISLIRDYNPSQNAAPSYANLIIDDYAKRQLLIYSGEVASQAINGGRKAFDIIADMQTKMAKLNTFSGMAEKHSYDIRSAVENASNATKNAVLDVKTLDSGINDLDEIIAIQKGELITIAAPTSQGKTAFLATIVLNSAHQGKRWLVFSLEGGHIPFTQRLIAQASGIETWRIMRGRILPSENNKYEQAIEDLKSLSIQIIDIPSIKIGEIKTQSRKKEYDCICVDYIQLAQPNKKNERRDLDIGEVTSGLKCLAMELNIPVIQLAQLNRTVESRAERKPGLYDLKESSSIENDSDTVIFIYRPDKLNVNAVKFIVAKHRNGRTGECDAVFLPGTMRFENAITKEIYYNGRDVE